MLDGDVQDLHERGFVVLNGMVPPEKMELMSRAYDAAVACAAPEDVRIGSTTTRIADFVNRGAEFDRVYMFPSLLDACERVIGGPFKLSSFHARTLRNGVPGQDLHVDVRRRSADWPLVGFILMVDEFWSGNGATRFIPGSHQWPDAPEDVMRDLQADREDQVLACGPAGSLLVFNGSTWHGHTSNMSGAPRRSLQGAFIPRGGMAATDFSARMAPETHARLGPQARDVLGV